MGSVAAHAVVPDYPEVSKRDRGLRPARAKARAPLQERNSPIPKPANSRPWKAASMKRSRYFTQARRTGRSCNHRRSSKSPERLHPNGGSTEIGGHVIRALGGARTEAGVTFLDDCQAWGLWISRDSHRTHHSTPICLRLYLPSKLFQRTQASARAFLSGSFASGASPARMKPCPAPS